MTFSSSLNSRSERAFSLIEVLLAVIILGIGLIMVATIFPVGADWTRQTAENSISQTVSQNALAVIRSHYSIGGDLASNLAPSKFTSPVTEVQALPAVGTIPIGERSYQFGSSKPFPPATPSSATFFWTAVARVSPETSTAAMSYHKYDIFILVYHKNAVEHQFTSVAGELTACRNGESFVPQIVKGTYSNITAPFVPPVNTIGIGVTSGTVFRQTASAASVIAKPQIVLSPTAENVLYSPPPDNTTSGSPLVYVLQTTLSQ